MELPRDGQEFAKITFTALTFNVPVEASIDERVTWLPTSAGTSPLERRILLRGPTYSGTEGTLVPEDTRLWVRVADTPESLVRLAGRIYLS
jgi:hypothetical protein